MQVFDGFPGDGLFLRDVKKGPGGNVVAVDVVLRWKKSAAVGAGGLSLSDKLRQISSDRHIGNLKRVAEGLHIHKTL